MLQLKFDKMDVVEEADHRVRRRGFGTRWEEGILRLCESNVTIRFRSYSDIQKSGTFVEYDSFCSFASALSCFIVLVWDDTLVTFPKVSLGVSRGATLGGPGSSRTMPGALFAPWHTWRLSPSHWWKHWWKNCCSNRPRPLEVS